MNTLLNTTLINLKKLFLEPNEIKLKTLGLASRDFSKTYYPPRSKKVLNLIKNFQNNNFIKSTLGGCIFVKKNNQLLISREF